MQRLACLPVLAAALFALLAPPASAAAPANDAPSAPAPFEPYTAANGTPTERQGVADLAEARADPGVPRCLGRRSFDRTVWFVAPGTPEPRELTVEAAGRTLGVVDLAAFVQPKPGGPSSTARPNACAGRGASGSDAAGDRTSAVTLRVPAGRAVLIQVGRRGAPGTPEDEQAVLSLVEVGLGATLPPVGDRAGLATPWLARRGTGRVALAGATTSAEDPATPTCPSMGGVWRRARPRQPGRHLITAAGSQAAALSVFVGARPSPRGALDCIDRDGPGPLVLPVTLRTLRPVWIRIGTDRPPPSSQARVRLAPAAPDAVRSGGGCLPSEDPGIGGALGAGSPLARVRNRSRRITLGVEVTRGPVCAARLRLIGPEGRLYARGDVAALRTRRQAVELRRVRKLVRGRYRLRVEATGLAGRRDAVPSRLTFTLR